MTLANHILRTVGGSEEKLYVDDVFSTWLYTAVGGNQTVVNGIDLASKGGLVWGKARSTTGPHFLYDSARSPSIALSTASNAATTSVNASDILFNADGFRIPGDGVTTGSGKTFTTWTFRKAPKFFDVVTYTGNGANRTISHALGQEVGLIFIKRTDAISDWQVYHRSLANTEYMVLNTTVAKATGATRWNSTTATTSAFSLGTDVPVNASGGTYVAYLFAHDTSTDGIIQCGSYTGTGADQQIALGWEVQYLMVKASSATSNWTVLDTARGWVNGSIDTRLIPCASSAEGLTSAGHPNAAGFVMGGSDADSNSTGVTYNYLAIRRPNKPPTTGTQVYNAIARSGTGAATTVTGVGFAPDLVIGKERVTLAGPTPRFCDRLRGAPQYLASSDTSTEANTAQEVLAFLMDGVSLGNGGGNGAFNYSASSYISHFFKRAPGVFDVVATSDFDANPVSHSLGVTPELVIAKARNDGAGKWMGAVIEGSNVRNFSLNTTSPGYLLGVGWSSYFNSSNFLPTAIANDAGGGTKGSSSPTVIYLFATKAGVSKVGNYTGNGSSQTINCGFTTGARFILIKRTDSTGDWYVWDTARGVVSGNDPHLSLNTTAAEVTSDDSIDPDTTGFVVNQVSATNINVSAATYIFLALA